MEFLLTLDIIGIIAFSISGSMIAAKKNMDFFGVVMMGIITSVGGGVLRDLIVGNIPPLMFRDPLFVIVSFFVSSTLFLIMYFHLFSVPDFRQEHILETVLFVVDTVGLAAFTMDGFIIGQANEHASFFLSSFLGVCTGVGGGLLRDLCCMEIPGIFRKKIYAIASIAGCITSGTFWSINSNIALISGFCVICLIRLLAAKYRWSLPKIQ